MSVCASKGRQGEEGAALRGGDQEPPAVARCGRLNRPLPKLDRALRARSARAAERAGHLQEEGRRPQAGKGQQWSGRDATLGFALAAVPALHGPHVPACGRDTLTISLPGKLRRDLEKMARAEGVTSSEYVRRAVKADIFRRAMRAARRELVPQARAAGLHTDEDVFKIVS